MNPFTDLLGGRRSDGVTTAIPLRDRAWMPFRTTRAVGPIRTPSADQVRGLLIRLWIDDPWHPLLCRIDEQRAVQRRLTASELDDFLDDAVIEAPEGVDAADLTRLMQALPLRDLPFRIALSDGAAACRSAHVIADSSIANPWFFGLLRADAPAQALTALRVGDWPTYPLINAMVRSFAAHPVRAARAAGGLFPLGPAKPSKINSTKINSTKINSTKINSGAVGVPELVWATARPAVDQELRQWRKRNTPEVSMAAVWMAAAVRGLRASGVPTGEGVTTMVNCRRYLPEDSFVQGNFAVGPYLRPDDLTDPRSLGTALAAKTADGVPLMLLSAMTARSLVRGGKPGRLPTGLPEQPQPKINLSHFGRLTADDVSWRTDRAEEQGAQFVIGAEPSGQDAITYVFAQTPYGMHLSASAHPAVTDPTALQNALAAVADDPIDLLEQDLEPVDRLNAP